LPKQIHHACRGGAGCIGIVGWCILCQVCVQPQRLTECWGVGKDSSCMAQAHMDGDLISSP
jgi:hypothetical protein